jgi:hypothetical protein
VRQRFSQAHGSLNEGDIATVEAATRQWFRLAARNPRVPLAMPSVVVDDLWHEMVLHTREYAEFCDAALGRFLHHVPETDGRDRGARLQQTLRLAQADEGLDETALPLLFRVDRDLGIAGGGHYLADCGGRGQCFGATTALCLRHVTGTDRSPLAGWKNPPAADPNLYSSGASCGGG